MSIFKQLMATNIQFMTTKQALPYLFIIPYLLLTGCEADNKKHALPDDSAHLASSTEMSATSPATITNIEALQNYYATLNYTWPITSKQQIPESLLTELPRDIKLASPVGLKKALFIQALLPVVLAEQKNLLKKRDRVLQLLAQSNDSATITRNPWFVNLLKEYRINARLSLEKQKEELYKRVDTLPVELIIAQAAIESGWGTSRFAQEGNSLFGEWTFSKQGGLVPNDRHADKNHSVKQFDSIQLSVRSYLRNINRNNAYKELRSARANMRKNKQILNADELAVFLHRYSQKGYDYVDSVLSLLRSKDFAVISHLKLNDYFESPSS